ncbi:hypothetical protein FK531_14310 [Rhodococcus spelaei]|uniref:LysM domain-containing protein n=1 Tax=Rhodococcus spelaei TaxID=2546320 RepID=A0A541B7H0_9NOCA|nr:hypothetical protein [Rhodococcus spelaei]TQF68277.1 hypothetical protein FK531_14310 [Rhodococcus spelaei]
MFFTGSRYLTAGTYQVTRADGTVVTVTAIPAPTICAVRGWHRRATDRLDLIAYKYLQDATASWALCDANNALVPDALAARELIGIPEPGR